MFVINHAIVICILFIELHLEIICIFQFKIFFILNKKEFINYILFRNIDLYHNPKRGFTHLERNY